VINEVRPTSAALESWRRILPHASDERIAYLASVYTPERRWKQSYRSCGVDYPVDSSVPNRPELIKCPDCRGDGAGAGGSRDPDTWEALPCDVCRGVGLIPVEVLAWLNQAAERGCPDCEIPF